MTNAVRDAYDEFLAAKVPPSPTCGFAVAEESVSPILKLHQRAMVRWAVWRGRAAIFAAFGLGKSVVQLEIARIVRALVGGLALIVIPLGVRQEFIRDAAMLGIRVRFIRSIGEVDDPEIVYLTNYETVRDGKLDPNHFAVACLDEASCLRGFGGSKTFREFMRLFDRVAYRFVATATPSPNDFIELLAYAAFLGVMDVGQAKTRFFRRDSENADNLTLHPHKEEEFWLWVASWGLFVQRPSDLGFSDEGYDLPELRMVYHKVPVDYRGAQPDKSGQGQLFAAEAKGIVGASRVKRDTLQARVLKTAEILRADPDSRYILWHDLEAERLALEAAVPDSVSVFGSQDLEAREDAIVLFSDGWFPYLNAKPVIAGSGCNFQRHCHKAVFVGIGFKFNDFIQAIHRIQRFMQTHPVEIHVVYAESEGEVLRTLLRKWEQHKEMTAVMSEIIRKHGLNAPEMASILTRAMGVKEPITVTGDNYTLVRDDTIRATQRMADNSVDLIVTSIPFSTQYEYSPNYADLGHTDDNKHFWEHMGWLIPELFRVLAPGRDCCIHVKDRIVPGGMTGLGFQTVYPFADDCRVAFRAAGFAYLGEKTNLTDVVRENNQTYRLGWSEQCKDGTRMGAGLPEKVLLFRKPPTSAENGYADKPVVKDKRFYTRARWQLDAHHLMRSSGDRLIKPEEWATFDDAAETYRRWRAFNLDQVYDFEHHVKIGEALDGVGRLPPTFMLLPPHSWHDDVWGDVAQMVSLNTLQAAAGAEKHLCPLPFDIVDRLITQFSEPGEVVFDPFGGLMTVPFRAIKLGRRGRAHELNPGYFLDGVKHVESMAREMATPTLFDVLGERRAPEGEVAA